MDRRRGSLTSLVSVSAGRPSTVASSVLGSEWFESWTAFQVGSRHVDPATFHLDILHDVCNEQLQESVVMHLLSLLEENGASLTSAEDVEQAVGSLVNMFATLGAKTSTAIQCKYLYTATTLLLLHQDLAASSESLARLTHDSVNWLVTLANNATKERVLSQAAFECLVQVEEMFPGTLRPHYMEAKVKATNLDLLATLLTNETELRPDDVKTLVSSLHKLKPVELHGVLAKLYQMVRVEKSSPMVFKLFVTEFIYSSELYRHHFALELLHSFGLELFSSVEEQTLLSQLVSLCTHAGLAVGHRLLALDFAKSLAEGNKLPSELMYVELQPFDGPDSQEKKLNLLNESDASDRQLLDLLRGLETLSLSQGSDRATNAIYRVSHAMMTKRPSMRADLEKLMMSLVTHSPRNQLSRLLALMEAMPDTRDTMTTALVQKIVNLTDVAKEEPDVIAYFVAAEWIVKRVSFAGRDNELLALLDLLTEKCKGNASLVRYLLKFCEQMIRNQKLDSSLRIRLTETLDFVTTVSKSDVSVGSWAQIYSIAINSLDETENLNKVFAEDDDDDDLLSLVGECDPSACPVVVTRVGIDDQRQKVDLDKRPFAIPLKLQVDLRPDRPAIFSQVFTAVINVYSTEQSIDEEIICPLLKDGSVPRTVNLAVTPTNACPFSLCVSVQFGDSVGCNYVCDNFHVIPIEFKDAISPVELGGLEFDQLYANCSQQSQFVRSVICLKQFATTHQLVARFPWISDFLATGSGGDMALAVPPKCLGLIQIREINNFVNLLVLTDNCDVLGLIYRQFDGPNGSLLLA